MDDNSLLSFLEELTDGTTLTRVLVQLGDMCDLKADHVMENWQDETLSASWASMARIVRSAASCAEKRGM